MASAPLSSDFSGADRRGYAAHDRDAERAANDGWRRLRRPDAPVARLSDPVITSVAGNMVNPTRYRAMPSPIRSPSRAC